MSKISKHEIIKMINKESSRRLPNINSLIENLIEDGKFTKEDFEKHFNDLESPFYFTELEDFKYSVKIAFVNT